MSCYFPIELKENGLWNIQRKRQICLAFLASVSPSNIKVTRMFFRVIVWNKWKNTHESTYQLCNKKCSKESPLLIILLDQEIKTIIYLSGMFHSTIRVLLPSVLLYSKYNPDWTVISNSLDSEVKS